VLVGQISNASHRGGRHQRESFVAAAMRGYRGWAMIDKRGLPTFAGRNFGRCLRVGCPGAGAELTPAQTAIRLFRAT